MIWSLGRHAALVNAAMESIRVRVRQTSSSLPWAHLHGLFVCCRLNDALWEVLGLLLLLLKAVAVALALGLG